MRRSIKRHAAEATHQRASCSEVRGYNPPLSSDLRARARLVRAKACGRLGHVRTANEAGAAPMSRFSTARFEMVYLLICSPICSRMQPEWGIIHLQYGIV
uniref:Uncharacterized protein n=1 Tax=Knipowitschia caucasica TaxID=637954 RepID=A0AAV2K9U6_KNICA